MTVIMTAIKDAMTGYGQPSQAINRGAAIRSFSDLVHDSKLIASHPEDYSLWYIGDYDLDSGVVIPHMELLASACDYVEVTVSENVRFNND